MNVIRPFTSTVERLRSAGLRPTRQRLALAKALFENGDRHVTAEILHGETQAKGIRVSLATIYNTLHQFTEAGLLREIVVDAQRCYFDTNTSEHHHYYHEKSGMLEDMDIASDMLAAIPTPKGKKIKQVDIIVRTED